MYGKHLLREVLQDTTAATAVEYGLLIGLLMLAISATMSGFSGQVIIMWQSIIDTLSRHIV